MSKFKYGETSVWYNVYLFEHNGSWTQLNPMTVFCEEDDDYFTDLEEAEEFRQRCIDEADYNPARVKTVKETRVVMEKQDD